MNKLIAFFEQGNAKYYISLNPEKGLFYQKYLDGKIDNTLSEPEKIMLHNVCASLTIHPEQSTYIKDLFLNGNHYKLFIDNKTNNYYWISLTGIDSETDNNYLNFKYNHQLPIAFYEETSYSTEEKKNERQDYYIKIVKIGKKLVCLFVAAGISLSIANGISVKKNTSTIPTSNTSTITITQSTNCFPQLEYEIPKSIHEYNYDEIKDAIASNPNFTDQEKDFLYRLKFVFDENYQYMDLDIVVNRLKTLKITYAANCTNSNNKKTAFVTDGLYNQIENSIEIAAPSFQEAKGTFTHEFCHVLQTGVVPLTGELSNCLFTNEIMERLLIENRIDKIFFLPPAVAEAYKNGTLVISSDEDWRYLTSLTSLFNSTYLNYAQIYSTLANILPQETLKKYQFNPSDTNILVEELAKIEENKDQKTPGECLSNARRTIDDINAIRSLSEDRQSYDYNWDCSSCIDNLDYYYQLKTGASIFENIDACLKLREILPKLSVEQENKVQTIDYYNGSKQMINYYCRTIFSPARENTIIQYREDDTTFDLEITPEVTSDFQRYAQQRNMLEQPLTAEIESTSKQSK